MSLQTLLTHRCTVRTVTSGGTDLHGAQVDDVSDETGVACRLELLEGRELNQSAAAAVGMHRLFLAAGTTVSEKSRILDVVDGAGTTLLELGEVAFVSQVSGRRAVSHVECWVKEVRT